MYLVFTPMPGNSGYHRRLVFVAECDIFQVLTPLFVGSAQALWASFRFYFDLTN